ncbi:K02A2.6-like [Cordylochernes scorpioides]|uniref:RNA-directed DNA polymerase n=1 Tax=Cordylochernes scorpioides TaxID=51811 RepID=A0ABY6L4B7_9ARAC|nr:K02A2.6-like [Cordylochernes scorpioides]
MDKAIEIAKQTEAVRMQQKSLRDDCLAESNDQISSDERWNCKVAINKRIMPFEIDTGADVSEMPENCFNQNFSLQLGKTQKRLYAAGMAMPVLGIFQNSEIQICVDLTKLNEKIKRERYQMPILEETLSQLSNGKVFSKLDANSGFWQIPLDDKLKQVLSKLKETGLALIKEKCVFSSPKLKFLGHQIGPDGLKPDEKKIRVIIEMPSPQNVTELKRFLGMINYLSRFIPSLAERAHPLYSLLSQKDDWFWGDNQVKAFETLKKALSSFPTLAMYNPSYKTFITADASSFDLGAYLSQINGKNQRQIIAYASRSLSETERKYAQIEKEALALTWAMAMEDLSPRIQRMKLRMMRYSFKIKYIPGKENILADVLSRAPRSKVGKEELQEEILAFINNMELHSDVSDKWIKEIAFHQSKDPTIQRVKIMFKIIGRIKVNFPKMKIFKIREILSRIHEGHQGVTKCRRRMRESVYWPKSYKDVEQMVLNCNECIKEISSRKEPIIMTDFPDRPWNEVAMDLCQFEGKHFLVITDYYSRYPEFSRLDNLSAETVILHTKSIFARQGIPELVRTDNGPQFKNYLLQNFEKGLLAYRTSPLENGFSPSELLMGRKLRTDLPTHPDPLKPTLVNQGLLNQKEHKYRERERRSYNNHWKVRSQKEFDVGDQVWVRDLKVSRTIIGRADQPRSYLVKEFEEIIPEVTQVDLPESSEQDPSLCEVEQQDPSSCEVKLQQDSQGLLGEGGTSRPYITRTGSGETARETNPLA